MSKEKKKTKPIIAGVLTLRDIDRKHVTYRFRQTIGPEIKNSHFQIPREVFPDDDNFNMNFINMDLSDVRDIDNNVVEVPKGAKKKQADFRKYLEYDLLVKRKDQFLPNHVLKEDKPSPA